MHWILAVASLTGQSLQKKTTLFQWHEDIFHFFSESVDPLCRCSGSHFTRYSFSEAKVQCQKATAASIGRHRLVKVQCGRNIVPIQADSHYKKKKPKQKTS